MRLVPLLVALCGLAACGPLTVDAGTYDVACVNDDDCLLYPFDDVCQGCATVPIGASERERADADLSEARQQCVLGVSDCMQTLEPACEDQRCVARALGSTEGEGSSP